MGAFIMLGSLIGLVALIVGVVLRYDPQARSLPAGKGER